jgi:hypothetical protein
LYPFIFEPAKARLALSTYRGIAGLGSEDRIHGLQYGWCSSWSPDLAEGQTGMQLPFSATAETCMRQKAPPKLEQDTPSASPRAPHPRFVASSADTPMAVERRSLVSEDGENLGVRHLEALHAVCAEKLA